MTAKVRPIRYGSDAAFNAVLRSALAKVANYQCYACFEPKQFSELQIDHLIARSTPMSSVATMSAAYKAGGFHVDDPENLAVICGTCNLLKSDRDQSNKLAFQMQLDRSVKRAEEVRATVQSIRGGHGLAANLARAAAAEIATPATRATFLAFAPGIVQQLATLGEEHVNFVTSQSTFARESGTEFDLRLLLNARLRFVRDLTLTLFNAQLLDIIQDAAGVITTDLEDAIERELVVGPDADYPRHLVVSDTHVMHLEIVVDSGDATWDGSEVDYFFEGAVDGWMTAHVLGDDPSTLTGTRDSMTDVWVVGRFALRLSIPLDDRKRARDPDITSDLSKVDVDIDWGS